MRKILWGILASSVIISVCVFIVFNNAFSPYNRQKHVISELVISEGILTSVTNFYWYQADQKVLSVLGKNNTNENVYVIVEEDNTAHLYYEHDLIAEANAFNIVHMIDSNVTVLKTALGWYQKQPVWEITYLANGQLCYLTISSIDGHIIQHIKSI